MLASFRIAVKILLQDIGEKEELQDGKHDEELDQDDPPEFPAPGHVPETVIIEVKDLFEHGQG